MGLLLAVVAGNAAAQEFSTPKWGANIDLEAKAGTKRNLGEIDIFAPLKQDARTLYFVNLRGRFDDNSSREGNLGLGVRQMQESGWNLGAYAYLDRRRSEQGHYFNQTTLGADGPGLGFPCQRLPAPGREEPRPGQHGGRE